MGPLWAAPDRRFTLFDAKDIEPVAGILDFLGGGIPPVFEEYGAEALRAGTVRAAGGGLDGVTYASPDAGVYNLSTPQGRRAWKVSAPTGVSRIVLEDGGPWVQCVLDTVGEYVSDWAIERGADI